MNKLKHIIDFLLRIAPDADLEADHARDLRTLNLCTYLVIFVGIPFIIKYYTMGLPWMSGAVALTTVVGIINLVILRSTLNVKLCGHIATCAIFFLLTVSNSISGGFYDPNLSLLYTIPLIAGFIMGFRALVIYSCLLFVTVLAFYFLPDFGIVIPDLIPAQEHAAQSLANRLGAIAIIIALAAGFIYERDTTHREVEAQKRKAELSNEAKSNFLSTMSHEIRTPMNAILGFSQLLGDRLEEAELRTLNEQVSTAANSLMNLINEILDLSKIDSGKVTLQHAPFNLRRVANEVVDLFSKEAADKQLELLFVIDDEIPLELIGDQSRLRQLFINLIGNALKFTEQGEIVVTASLNMIDEGEATLSFKISDSGIGMSEGGLENVFDRFVQVDQGNTRNYGGTGLGLAICQEIVTLMNGKLSVESKSGVGTSFFFTAKFSIDASHFYRVNTTSQLYAGNHILLVNSNAKTNSAISNYLTELGVQLSTTSDVEETLRALRAEEYRAVIIDCNVFDSLTTDNDVTKFLVETIRRQQMPVIYLSQLIQASETSSHNIAMALDAVCVPKPLKIEQLKATLDSILNIDNKPDVKETFTASPLRIKEIADKQPEFRFYQERLRGLEVLLADDLETNQILAKAVLDSVGVSTTIVCNGKQAVSAMETQIFDIVLMDLNMPEMDGLQATGIIREQLGDTRTPIIAMSANARPADYEHHAENGINDYIGKPFAFKELFQKLIHWSGRGSQDLQNALLKGMQSERNLNACQSKLRDYFAEEVLHENDAGNDTDDSLVMSEDQAAFDSLGIAESLGKLQSLLSQCDGETSHYFEEIRVNFEEANIPKQELQRLGELIAVYDFDAAQHSLSNITNNLSH